MGKASQEFIDRTDDALEFVAALPVLDLERALDCGDHLLNDLGGVEPRPIDPDDDPEERFFGRRSAKDSDQKDAIARSLSNADSADPRSQA